MNNVYLKICTGILALLSLAANGSCQPADSSVAAQPAAAQTATIAPPQAVPQGQEAGIFCSAANEFSQKRKGFSYIDSVMNDAATVKVIDSLFMLKTEERYVNKFTSKPPVYFGAAFKTLPYSFEKVTKIIKYCPSYQDMFKHIMRFQIISTNSDIPACQTAYAVVQIAFIKSWFIVNIDSIATNPSGRWGMYYSKNYLPTLNDVWEKQERSSFTYPARDINIRFYAQQIDETHTRVGYILAIDSKSGVPGWVFKIVGKWVFPRFMKDIEIALQKDSGKK